MNPFCCPQPEMNTRSSECQLYASEQCCTAPWPASHELRHCHIAAALGAVVRRVLQEGGQKQDAERGDAAHPVQRAAGGPVADEKAAISASCATGMQGSFRKGVKDRTPSVATPPILCSAPRVAL